MGETKNAYKFLVKISSDKRRPGAFRGVKQNKIKCDVSQRVYQA
jgi:hypothetical protein